MTIQLVTIKNVLTRTTGYLKTVTSHSLQPYRGCTLGRSLCGIGCYVQHNRYVTHGRPWGEFLEVRENAAQSYVDHVERERRWAHRSERPFGVFLSSSTEPFLPQEFRHGITRQVLETMLDHPPDVLVVQTHSHRICDYGALLKELDQQCELRAHISIETDRDALPGLPPHASSIARRLDAARNLREAGIRTVITVSPLLPIASPETFFARIAECADAVVLDHFIQGDGSPDGSRTLRTDLPLAMREVSPDSVDLDYRDRMVEVARRHLPGRVGVNIDGFAGRFLDGET
jgi:DNA repair photolyase